MDMFRLLGNPNTGGGTAKRDGRTYTVAANSFIDVPDGDSRTMHGFVNAGLVGTTAQRPVNAAAGAHFIDTTAAKVVVSDGAGSWRDPFTGGVV